MSHNKIRNKAENEILGSLINELVGFGYEIRLEDRGPCIMINVHENGSDAATGWVRFVTGNGSDCVSDYTVNLAAAIKETSALADTYRD